ncbi:MAG TPA: hypothetical protein PLO99_11855 [Chitinophagaceae bacterium]|nr:hypothetical protein [Chitinophagaceae bacterium]
MILKKIIHNCKAAQESGIRLQAGSKIGIKAWLAMQIHLITCKCCRMFLRQSKLIDKAIEKHKDNLAQPSRHKFTEAEKNLIKQRLGDR